MLPLEIFKTIVEYTPLISIDFIVKNDKEEILLGKRLNAPAKGYYFTLGGRIYKNETMQNAMRRIAKEEIGIELDIVKSQFIGVFEHFYDDSFADEAISTHYVNHGYSITVGDLDNLPKAQHTTYEWFGIDALIQSSEVHPYVKDYFKNTHQAPKGESNG